MRLTARIANARMDDATAGVFVAALRHLAGADGVVREPEAQLVARLTAGLAGSEVGGLLLGPVLARVDDAHQGAEVELLWPHAELFLTACIFVAVADGDYGVDEARVISRYAHRLGMSSKQLAALEARVFEQLKARAERAG
jgi:uncharacterized tellurite resistance protein B-like protein